MRRLFCAFVLVLLTICTPPTHARYAAVVQQMHIPAWLQRDEQRYLLQPGVALKNGDQIITGAHSRIVLRLADGSAVKLGEHAVFLFNEAQPGRSKTSLFHAALQLVKGAFRLTTGIFGKSSEHSVEVRIGAITVGVRETDIWGKVSEERELIALLNGKIQVQPLDKDEFEMNQPLTYYMQTQDGQAIPISAIQPDELAQWAEETELREGEGMLARGGKWVVNIMSFSSQQSADTQLRRLLKRGYPVKIEKISKDREAIYRIQITGFASMQDARAFALSLNESLGIRDAWILSK